MQRAKMDLWVGLFVIAGIGALLILALQVGNLGTYSEDKSYTLVGNFENIENIKIIQTYRDCQKYRNNPDCRED